MNLQETIIVLETGPIYRYKRQKVWEVKRRFGKLFFLRINCSLSPVQWTDFTVSVSYGFFVKQEKLVVNYIMNVLVCVQFLEH